MIRNRERDGKTSCQSSQQTGDQLFPITITSTEAKKKLNKPILPVFHCSHSKHKFYQASLLLKENSKLRLTFNRSAFFSLKQDTRKCSRLHKASCTVVRVSFLLSFLSLLFNPVTSAPRAGEVSQRLSHGLRANPTPRALPEGRPSVRSVWSVLGGKASAAQPNPTFQHTPPS